MCCGGRSRVLPAIALIVSILLGVIGISADIGAILYHQCYFYFDGSGTIFSYFSNNYLSGPKCNASIVWYRCQESNMIMVVEDSWFHTFTDRDSTFLCIVVHLGLQVLWLLSSAILTRSICSPTGRTFYFPWLVATPLVLLFGLTTSVLYLTDFSTAMTVKGCWPEEDNSSLLFNYIFSTVIMPLYLSQGVVFWILELVLWGLVVSNVLRTEQTSKPRTTKKQQVPVGRTLSDAPSDYEDRINKRFQNVQKVDEREDQKSLQGHYMTPPPEQKRTSRFEAQQPDKVINYDHWVYSNGAYQPEESYLKRQRSKEESPLTQGNHYAMPQTFSTNYQSPRTKYLPDQHHDKARRTTSDVSDISLDRDNRKIGRPKSMPPIPKVDYPLPRASVVSRPHLQEQQHRSPRKAIRTPSGRSVSATEYLKGGYTPRENPLREEDIDEDVDRYFVKLKR